MVRPGARSPPGVRPIIGSRLKAMKSSMRQFAVAVGVHQFVVPAHERLGVDPAQAAHLLAPQGGAVAVDQGVVQIKNYQMPSVHALFNKSLPSGYLTQRRRIDGKRQALTIGMQIGRPNG